MPASNGAAGFDNYLEDLFCLRSAASLGRQTTFSPDQSSSIAATLTSTSPSGRTASRMTLSVTSLTCPAALRGHAIHSAPAGKIRSPQAPRDRARRRRGRTRRARRPGRRATRSTSADRRTPSPPARRRRDAQPRLEAELARLRRRRVPGHARELPVRRGSVTRARRTVTWGATGDRVDRAVDALLADRTRRAELLRPQADAQFLDLPADRRARPPRPRASPAARATSSS